MTVWLGLVATGLLLSLAGALWRVWRGPGQADRMMAAQLVGTGGVGVVMLLAALGDWAALDVALVLALLAAFAAVAFVKAASPGGTGDPEQSGALLPGEGDAGPAPHAGGAAPRDTAAGAGRMPRGAARTDRGMPPEARG